MQIATFDFHNTVAYCDPWFQLEIRELPGEVLELLALRTGISVTADLRDEATGRYRALRQTIMESGVEVDALESVQRIFRDMDLPVDRPALTQAIDELMRATLSDAEPVPGSAETIVSLVDSGVPVGIISSAVYHPFLEWVLARFGLLERLAFVATSASVGYYKSDARIYRHAYERVNATTELGVHVGDSPRWDVDTAKQAGLAAVLYDHPGVKRQTPSPDGLAPPDLVLDSLIGADRPILDLLAARRNGKAGR
ncbi:MAG TPA: HAD family hydrolase [Thermomicrobiales bacterium]|nr:HAD family hydrolase [Thermomicrobiales bacterium]